MNTVSVVTPGNTRYTVNAAIRVLPQDIDEALFLKVVNQCLPEAKTLSVRMKVHGFGKCTDFPRFPTSSS
jgi:hypothetical protein